MSKVLESPGRPLASRRSKVDRSWRILSGSSTAAASLLVLWLIVAAMSGRGSGLKTGLIVAIEPSDSVSGALPPILGDADLIAGAVGLSDNASAAGADELIRQLEALSSLGSTPRVVSLSAVGISSSADGQGATPYFLPIGGDPSDPGSLIPAERVIALLTDRERMGGPTLLILDVAHVDSDRGSGVFANSFLHRLERLIPESGELVVLTSCAPGQVNWSAEPFGRSVFADCVARSNSWGRGTVSDLHKDVASRVAAWARSYREAEQTPLLLGNTRRRNFRLPPLRGSIATPASRGESEEFTQRLRDAWTVHQALAETRPDRLAPLPWRRYRDELLRAERFYRTGRLAEADLSLNAVETLAGALRPQLDAPPPGGLPSFALRLAMASPGSRDAIQKEWESAEEVLRRFLNGEEPDPIPPPARTPGESVDTAESTEPEATGADQPSPPSIASLPRNVEGLMAARYAQFVSLGGESDELRSARLESLTAAFDAAILGERASAVDGRLIPWVGPLVGLGDRKRLEGQDLLFAGDLALIRSARDPLREAEAHYAEALALAEPLTEAIDLLQDLADVLPYYGEWAASDLARHAMISTILDEAGALADRIAEPPSGWASSSTNQADAPLDEIRKRLGNVRSSVNAMRQVFSREVGIASRPGSRPRWRTLDALLKVPTIPIEARMTLLDAVSAPSLSPLPASETISIPSGDPAVDEAFWNRALGLARLELGLLRIAGEPIDDLRGYLGTSETWNTAPDAAFGAMDSLSEGIRRRRDALLDPDPGIAGSGSRSPRSTRGALDRADWLARSLPAAAMHHRIGLAESPSAVRGARDRQDLLVWHGRRLADDLALELARDALLAASTFGVETTELAEARLELNRAQTRAIRVENLRVGDDPANKAPGLAVSGGEALPSGSASLLLKHDPAVSLRSRPQGGAIVSVPVEGRVERRFDIDFAEGVDVVPAVYYRGQVFDAGRVSVPQIEQVSVAIRQYFDHAVDSRGREILVKGRRIKVPDQFEEHPDEGYLHPNSTLDYRLELTNWTAEPLPVVVVQRWEEGPAKEARVAIPPGESIPQAALGQISSIDFGPEQTSKMLTIEVREEGGLGRLLCKPKQVVFRTLEPKQYMSIHPHFAGGRNPQVGLFVQHLNTDRTTVPAHVTVAIEPFSAVFQLDAPQWVERGSFVTCRYRIVDPKVETLKFSLTIDGITNAIVEEYRIQELKEAPPPMPPPNSPNMPRL